MTKGFVLTLDAFIAIITAVAISAVIINVIYVGGVSYFDKQQLAAIGYDLLAVLDLSKKFSSYIGMGGSQVEIDLGQQLQVLPQRYCGNISVSIYTGDIGPPVDFTLENVYNNLTDGCTKNQEITKVKRIFVNHDPQKFGFVELELWLR